MNSTPPCFVCLMRENYPNKTDYSEEFVKERIGEFYEDEYALNPPICGLHYLQSIFFGNNDEAENN